MKKDYSNIEDLFKDSFDGYQVEPSTSAWKGINGKLNLKQLLRPGLKHFNVYYLSTIVGIIAVVGVLLFNDKDREPTNVNQTAISNNEIVTEKSASTNETKETINEKISKKEYKSKTRIQQRVENQKLNEVTERSKVADIIPITQNYKVEKIPDDFKDSMSELNKIKVQPPKPLFQLNNKQGCAPFKIKLFNYTELAQKYEWMFGDGSKSKDKNPTHTYRYPGIYKITLKASGIGGIAYSVIDSVIVHESVENKINYSFNSELTEGELFAISVNTNQKADYQWIFGDGTYSYKQNPTHKYQKEGHYSISLITLTDNNCYDSVKVADAIVVKSTKKVGFPTAFCPNPNGPSEGKYSINDLHNTIFHPIVKGQLAEYNLKVFSKTGLLIFESDDTKIGWDGYYQNRLMPSGVYPYVVTYKFEGDNKPIQQRGDVTILHSK